MRPGIEIGMPVHRLVDTMSTIMSFLAVLCKTICFIKLQLNPLNIITDEISHLVV